MVPSENSVCHNCGYALYRKVSWRLLIACIIMPAIFCWFLLRKGYSKKTKIIAVACGLLGITLAIETITSFSFDSISTANNSNSMQIEGDIKSKLSKIIESELNKHGTHPMGGTYDDATIQEYDINSDGMNDYYYEIITGNDEKGQSGVYQAILLADGDSYKVSFERLGGYYTSRFTVESVTTGVIKGTATLYGKGDPMCCPSITKEANIIWNGTEFEQDWVDNSPF